MPSLGVSSLVPALCCRNLTTEQVCLVEVHPRATTGATKSFSKLRTISFNGPCPAFRAAPAHSGNG